MGRKLTLSARMQAVAGMVTKGSRVCDVGCDHGYIPIYLIQNEISPKVLAMDIHKGPLQRAREHILKAGLEDYITLRLSDGLVKYMTGEADTLILAGMGGRLMQEILDREPIKTRDFKELILQPQSEISDFRKYLRKAGYFIEGEEMVWEEGKFYTIIRSVPVEGAKLKEEFDFHGENALELADRFGPVLLRNRHPVLVQYLKKEWGNSLALKEMLTAAENSPGACRRMAVLEEEMQYLKRAADICGCRLL